MSTILGKLRKLLFADVTKRICQFFARFCHYYITRPNFSVIQGDVPHKTRVWMPCLNSFNKHHDNPCRLLQ